MFSRRNPWQLILPISLFFASPVFAQVVDIDPSEQPDAPIVQEIEQEEPAPAINDGDVAPLKRTAPATEDSPKPVETPAPTASEDFAIEEQDLQEQPPQDSELAPSPLFAEPKIARGKSPDVTVRGNSNVADLLDRWDVTVGGYLRTAYTWVDDDANLQSVGRNDGFNFADARLSFAGNMDNGLGFFFEFNGAANIGADSNNAPAH